MQLAKRRIFEDATTPYNSMQTLKRKGKKPIFFSKLTKGSKSAFGKREIKHKPLKIERKANKNLKQNFYFLVIFIGFSFVLFQEYQEKTDVQNFRRISNIVSESRLSSIKYSSNSLIRLKTVESKGKTVIAENTFWPVELSQTFGETQITLNIYYFEAVEAVCSIFFTLMLLFILGPVYNSTVKMMSAKIFFPLAQLCILIETFNRSENAFTADSQPNVVGSLDSAIKMHLKHKSDCVFNETLLFLRNKSMILFRLVASIYDSNTFNWAKSKPKSDHFTKKRRISALIRLGKPSAFKELIDYLVASGADCKFVGRNTVLFVWADDIGSSEMNSTMIAFYSVVDGLKMLQTAKLNTEQNVAFSIGTVLNFLVRGDERIEECFIGESVGKCAEMLEIGEKFDYSLTVCQELFSVLESDIKKDCSLIDIIGKKPIYSRVYGMKTNFKAKKFSFNDFKFTATQMGKMFKTSNKCLIKLSAVKNTVDFAERNADNALRVLVTNLINCKDDKHSEIFSKYCQINGESVVAERIYNKIRKQLDWHL